MSRRRYLLASVIAVTGFGALFMALPSQGAGVRVKIVDFRYQPSSITVHVGRAATFSNDTTLTHTATCPDCGVDSGDIQPATFKTLTFNKAGRFELSCRYHGSQGMVATVTVEP